MKHLTDLLCSEVLRPPLDGAVQGYLELRGSDLYSSRTASCTGTKGNASKTISIVKKYILTRTAFLDHLTKNISVVK